MSIKVLTIINPSSGRGDILEKEEEIKKNMQELGLEVDVKHTTKEYNAKNIIEDYDKEKDLILICGGDGTLNEAVTAIMEKGEQDISLTFVPLGTTNDYAKSLDIPAKNISITKNLLKTRARRVDIGSFNEDKYFCYVAAFGVITDVAYKTTPKAKNKYGRLAYYINAVKELRKIPTYKLKLRYDDKHIEDEFIYGGISNSESIAGFKWFEKGEIQLDDGKFEGIFIRKPKSIFGYFKILSSFFRKEYSENEYILFTEASHLEIISEKKMAWTIDGEFAGETNNVIIDNHKKAIEFAIYESEK